MAIGGQIASRILSGYTLSVVQFKRGCVMGYAELISKLESLPREKQAEVFEFVEFLSARTSTLADKSHSRAEVAAQTWNTFNERSG